MQTKIVVLTLAAVALTCTNMALAKKGAGNWANKGSLRSQSQHAINALHPTGQARAAAQHALNNNRGIMPLPGVNPIPLVKPGKGPKSFPVVNPVGFPGNVKGPKAIPPGQLKKLN